MVRSKNYIQFGCGLCAPGGWRNFDASPTLRVQRLPLLAAFFRRGDFPVFPANVEYGDIVRGLPVEPEVCDGIYCSHVLEHLALQDLRVAIKNVHAYLKPNGCFRCVVPDLEYLAHVYTASKSDNAALDFMHDTGLGRETRPRGIAGLLRAWLGNSAHLWLWDYKSLSQELQSAGFRNIRRARFGDALDPEFQAVEEQDRWKNCLGIECVR